MKLLYFLWMVLPQLAYSQHYANKEYYLIDSLVLTDLNDLDRTLIDSCITVYHKETVDTLKLAAISYIAENCMDSYIWPKYNLWIYNYTKDNISTPFFYNQYTSSIGNIG